MSDARFTRRTALSGAAALGLASHGVGLADALGHDSAIFSRWVGSLTAGESRPIGAARTFALLGVEWAGPRRARIELRTRASDGRWSGWTLASVTGHGPDNPAPTTTFVGDPIWTGPADAVQLRSGAALHGVRIHFIAATVPPGASAAAAYPLAQPVLDAGPGQPPIIARQAWSHGARPSVAPGYGTVKLGFVHHTENPNGYGEGEVPGMLYAIYQFHRFVRGWHDIGYNFVIDLFGRIWEARQGGIDQAVIGAQAGGYNQVSTGVAVLGTFMDVVPSSAALDALEQLMAWKLSLHGVPTAGRVTVKVNPSDAFYTPFRPGAHVSLPRVAGHRDGDSTECPGNAFYGRLPALRPHIAQLAGGAAALRLKTPSQALIAPATIELSGTLARLGGGPLAGAPVEIQRVVGGAGTTLAELSTDSGGRFAYTVQSTVNVALQALHRPAPAAISDLVQIGVAPQVELAIVSLSPLRVTGQVSPAKRRVVIDVYALKGRHHRRLVGHKRVHVSGGRFAATLRLPGPGRHELVARTQADRSNAAGASKPLVVTG